MPVQPVLTIPQRPLLFLHPYSELILGTTEQVGLLILTMTNVPKNGAEGSIAFLAETIKKLEQMLTGLSARLDQSAIENSSEILTVAESAAILKISKKSVYRLIARRRLKANGSLRHLRITREEINRFLNS